MTNLTETATYEAGIYQLETTDPVVGGPNGIDNLQAKQLANRTKYLKAQVDQKLGASEKAANSELLGGFGGKIYAPPGAIISFATSSPPTGWIECNGASLSRAVYTDLFAAIGAVFGAGNGSTTFDLPDLRGEFIRGFDNGRGVDLGRSIGTVQSHAVELHTHYLESWASQTGDGAANPRNAGYGSAGPYGNTIPTKTQTGNTASETRPRNVAMLFCIKY
jgi:microcystin-dependent protein